MEFANDCEEPRILVFGAHESGKKSCLFIDNKKNPTFEQQKELMKGDHFMINHWFPISPESLIPEKDEEDLQQPKSKLIACLGTDYLHIYDVTKGTWIAADKNKGFKKN